MREVVLYSPIVLDGETYETVLAPLLGFTQSFQIIFPFETKHWMQFKIFGKNGLIESIETGPGSQLPVSLSKIYASKEFNYWVTVDVYKGNKFTHVETLKIKKSLIEVSSLCVLYIFILNMESTPIFDQYCFYIHRLKLRSVLDYKNKLPLLAKDPQEPRIVKLAKEIYDISINFDKYFYSDAARDLNNLKPNEVVESVENYISALIGFIGQENINEITKSEDSSLEDLPKEEDKSESSDESEKEDEDKEDKENTSEKDDSENKEEEKEDKPTIESEDGEPVEDEEDKKKLKKVEDKLKEVKITASANGKKLTDNIRKNLRFSWTTLAGKERSVNTSDSLVELCNSIYNLGIWYLGYSEYLVSSKSGDDGLDEDTRKTIYDYLLKAAGIFHILENRFIQSLSLDDKSNSLDFNDIFLRVLYLQCLGQAQEITIGRAFKNNTSPKLILSLAVETCNIYKEANSLLSSSVENLIESRVEKLSNFFQYKLQLYNAFSYNLLAFLQNAQYKYGESIATSKLSKDLLKQTTTLIKPAISNTLSVGSLQRPVNMLTKIIDLNLARFERENKLIGFHAVPEQPNLDDLQTGTKLAKHRDFQLPPQSEIWSPDLITLFNPQKKLSKADITPSVTSPTTTTTTSSSSSPSDKKK
ncbi:hypothetical protein DLAC_02044 [Tieghemostelium lacteum]|uniref:BRO1 domain-containing protein n=1 Tax=Tieghemostelium lacteum TaxID=361077 RepID=A0A152A503_TIELA|nr:hypothetical protein DLAC_02044 [Tieghemostelium lacteum]|eukprot:KYR01322.1 hypothetical protein DLAC_02044 [Tieghemostelium lacteum]